ncbi:MAG: alpha/beta hydrolase [Sphingomonadales bacterium]|jgi:pimeloyl-ACP methyl ester carboxylesterase|nr:alpha/beta hydrolase [Sphingomonadales bacterium]MBK9003194.1 alpha/beta hydrolase [Sphingomonadales bacterium]MBK9268442.1 alpha/beta hydrolase [Sphingomonadales bacterium]MBP6435081.1 alpha/beta hydrolase [Sphingorhabdus sp.]
MADFEDAYWTSNDELRLHYRDYPGPASRSPLICMPGLTRNARDFEPVAQLLGGKRRMLAIDFRGRGESAYAKDPMTYLPLTYAQDMDMLIRELNLKKFVLCGTSLGGIVSMLLAAQWKDRLAGVILNDVGPEIGQAGADRIRGYVGQGRSFETWMHAARAMAETQGDVYPDYRLEEWLRFAKRTCKLSSNGRIVFDYDMKIAEPFKLPGGEAGVDLWPLFALLEDVPMLVLRGEKSDILEKTTATKMVKKAKQATLATIKGIGHAPSLDEEAAQKAIAEFLAGVK